MNEQAITKFGVGARVQRIEDEALITGQGQFVSDIAPDNVVHGWVFRSPVAHATFTLDNLDAVRAVPGVHLVLSASDIKHLKDLPCKGRVKQADGSDPITHARPILADGIVRHIGEPVVFIVAESANIAKSAGELIEFDFDSLSAIVGTAEAVSSTALQVWNDMPGNVAFRYAMGDEKKTEALFASAVRVVSLDLVNSRVITNYMEPRGAIGEYDAMSGRYTLRAPTQGGHDMRSILADDVMGITPDNLRVLTGDVGGGFGTKAFVYQEYPLVLEAAKRLGLPVKWVGERGEHFLADSQGRDNVVTARLALDENNHFLALKIDLIANMGAYSSQFGPFIPWLGAIMVPGLYDFQAIHAEIKGVHTHTVPVDAYRGAGRPEAAFQLERLVDYTARELGVDAAELRRINFIASDKLPFQTLAGQLYDSGDYAGHMDHALEKAERTSFDVRLRESAKRGRLRGFGFATYVEACAFPGNEDAKIELHDDGTFTIYIGTQSNGQGHATAYGQVAAAHLGVDIAKIRLVQGDTDKVATGGGTGGSRSIPIGAVSVDHASIALVDKIKAIAAEELEAAAADLELIDGGVTIAGTDRSMTFTDVAKAAPNSDMLIAVKGYSPEAPTYPNGTHVCEVEIDPETGAIDIIRYVIVDDYGVTLNPLLLEGQAHGGVVQAAGQMLFEKTVYDGDGQLLTASLLDYAIPRADDFPVIEFETRNIPSPTNALGIKGAGEAGTIGAGPTIMNAVIDALDRAYGLRHIDMPATPDRVWEAIKAARGV